MAPISPRIIRVRPGPLILRKLAPVSPRLTGYRLQRDVTAGRRHTVSKYQFALRLKPTLTRARP